mmetsp:Transcript_9687/g.16958  ORF Transcript_9687/g.16958 Transcript_9687/m.16958 type:complete len:520 (+) Transcript_9687:3-1562(+)
MKLCETKIVNKVGDHSKSVLSKAWRSGNSRDLRMSSNRRIRTLLGHLRSGSEISGSGSSFLHLQRGLRSKSTMAASKDFYDVVCVGGGNSAGYLAKNLVDLDYTKTKKVAIVCGEPVPPYERPALSKAFLHPPDAKVRARLPGFHTSVGGGGERQLPEWYEEHNIDLLTSTKAIALNAEGNEVTVEGHGSTYNIRFEKLVLATGARALTPADIKTENADLGNVFTIREEEETRQLVNTLEANKDSIKNIVIVGGGYIGMETAAAFSGWGFNITMVMPEDQLMQRLFPKEVAEVFENYFSAKGIKVHKGNSVTGLVPSKDDEKVVGGVKLDSGDVIDAEAVIYGVGARVDTSLAEDLVKTGEGRTGGYAVNGSFRTSKENIFAIGDIAAVNGKQRFEHVDFCRRSAAQAAKAIVENGDVPDMKYLPYFYSRLFEYTDTPLIFQFYGNSDTSGDVSVKTFGDLKGALSTGANEKVPGFGAAWVDSSDIVKGLMYCNGSPEQYEKAKTAVVESAKFSSTMLD